MTTICLNAVILSEAKNLNISQIENSMKQDTVNMDTIFRKT